MSSETLKQQLIEDAKKDMIRFKIRYITLSKDLPRLFEAIEELVG